MRRPSFGSFLWVITTFIFLIASRAVAQSVATEPGGSTGLDALIVAIDADAANLSVRECLKPTDVCDNSPLINVQVDAPALRTILKPYQAGDRVRLKITYRKVPAQAVDAPATKPNTQVAPPAGGVAANAGSGAEAAVLMDFLGPSTSNPLGIWHRIGVLVGAAGVLFAIACLATGGHPLVFVVGMDNRYSNSKVQVALWFWIVISTYLAAWCFRIGAAGWHFAGMVNIPQNLLILSGLSAITYGGAKAITTSKADNADPVAKAAATAVALAHANLSDAKAALAQTPQDDGLAQSVTAAQATLDAMPTAVAGAKTQATDADRKFLPNLLQNDAGQFDFGDFQMLVVTVIAVTTYLILFVVSFENVAFTKAITLPDLDTTVLSIFGLGQGAYLAKKAGGDVGTS